MDDWQAYLRAATDIGIVSGSGARKRKPEPAKLDAGRYSAYYAQYKAQVT
jgi:hypothetical protein